MRSLAYVPWSGMTDICPDLQEGSYEEANIVDGFLGQPRQRYDPYTNFYNESGKITLILSTSHS